MQATGSFQCMLLRPHLGFCSSPDLKRDIWDTQGSSGWMKYITVLILFLKDLLRHCSHTTQFTHFTCTTQQFLVQSRSFAMRTASTLEHLHFPKGVLLPRCCAPVCPRPSAPGKHPLCAVPTDSPVLDTPYKWSRMGLCDWHLSLGTFPKHYFYCC